MNENTKLTSSSGTIDTGAPTVRVALPAPPRAAALPAERSARYREHGVLGRGGMGEVRLIEDVLIGREVAVKKVTTGRPRPLRGRARSTTQALMTSSTVDLRCRCGEVEGRLENAAPDTVNRIVCYCDDCQAYAHHLGRADLLDPHGGTDIVQVAPASLRFVRGTDRIAGLRLSPKGLYRWYASCCKTPVGNTVGPGLPFVGIAAQALRSLDVVGPPVGGILGKFAVGTAPPGTTRLSVRLLARAIRKVLGWKLRGQSWPHPFFDRTSRAPIYPITVLSHDEREALRPLCGPRPAS